MESINTYRTQESDRGERLDILLTKIIPDVSRALVQKAIKEGRVTLNKKHVTPHKRVEMNDEIQYENLNEKNPPVCTPNAQVIFVVVEETPEYSIINKPFGLIMHQSNAHPQNDTLANGLLARYPELASVGEDALRPGIVHRLDKDASGLIIVAHTQSMFEYLKKLFQERKVEKEYTAVVHGTFIQPTGTIDRPIMRSTSKEGRMAARTDGMGKEAITHFEVMKDTKGKTWLKVKIETGRTHQIRTHLAAIGHPIVGDTIYGGKMTKKDTGRLLLHATRLVFIDQNGARKEYINEPKFADNE